MMRKLQKARSVVTEFGNIEGVKRKMARTDPVVKKLTEFYRKGSLDLDSVNTLLEGSDKRKFAFSKGEILELLEQQNEKFSKSIENLTTLLTLAHTLSAVDSKSSPILDNVLSAMNDLLAAKTKLLTSKLFLQKLTGNNDTEKRITGKKAADLSDQEYAVVDELFGAGNIAVDDDEVPNTLIPVVKKLVSKKIVRKTKFGYQLVKTHLLKRPRA